MPQQENDDVGPVEKIARDEITRGILWLVHNGIPFDVAHALNAVELQAWSIIFSEFRGAKFDFETNQWTDPQQP